MSYEKYLKYKSKYLNLKAQVHNERLINQSGGADSDFSLNSLGSSPASNFSQNGGAKLVESDNSKQSSETSTKKLPNELTDSPPSSVVSETPTTPVVAPVVATPVVSETPTTPVAAPVVSDPPTTPVVAAPVVSDPPTTPVVAAPVVSETPVATGSDTKSCSQKGGVENKYSLFGGKKLIRKERDVFSDSDYDTTESSLLSFSSVEGNDSDDAY